MSNAKIGKELFVVTPNQVGMFLEVTGQIAGVGVNIKGIQAYAVDDKAYFRLVTDDNQKASDALKAKGFDVSEKEVVLAGLNDKVGAAKEVAEKIKDAGIDVKYIYGTNCECACTCDCVLVIASDNNAKLLELLQ